jgi:CCR4-NOT transcriptional complex subunit CAF120
MTGPHTQSYSGRPSGQNWQGEIQRPDQGRVVSSPQPNGRGPGQYRGPAPPGQNPNMGGMGERSQSMGFTPQRPTSQSSMGTSTNTHRAASNSPSASDPTQSPRHRNDSSTPTGSPGPVAPAKLSSRDAATPTTIGQAPGTDVPPPAAWTRPFQPIVELIGLQPAKVYGASPPELEMIVAKTSAGGPPKSVS